MYNVLVRTELKDYNCQLEDIYEITDFCEDILRNGASFDDGERGEIWFPPTSIKYVIYKEVNE